MIMYVSRLSILRVLVKSQKTQVRDVVEGIVSRSESNKLVGFDIDMFCTPMIDVANEFRNKLCVLYF